MDNKRIVYSKSKLEPLQEAHSYKEIVPVEYRNTNASEMLG